MSKSLRDRISRGLSSVLVLLSSGGTFQIFSNGIVRAMNNLNSSIEKKSAEESESFESALDEEGFQEMKKQKEEKKQKEKEEKNIDKKNQFTKIKTLFVEDSFCNREENVANSKRKEKINYDFDLDLSEIQNNEENYVFEEEEGINETLIGFRESQEKENNLTDCKLENRPKLEGEKKYKESHIKGKTKEKTFNLDVKKYINENEKNDEKKEGENNSDSFIKNEKKKLPSKTFLEDEGRKGRSFIQVHSWNERGALEKQLETGYHSEGQKLDAKKLTNVVKIKEKKEKGDESEAKAKLRIDKEGEKTDQDPNKSQYQYPIKEHPPAEGAEHNEWSTMKKCAVIVSTMFGLGVVGKVGYEMCKYLSDNTDTEYDDDDDVDWDEWDYKL